MPGGGKIKECLQREKAHRADIDGGEHKENFVTKGGLDLEREPRNDEI